jgi:thiosulfate/3-mercaptopyruvate sulfurtransferase
MRSAAFAASPLVDAASAHAALQSLMPAVPPPHGAAASSLRPGAGLARDAIVLLDASFDLADPAAGERAWAQGHVPSAQYAHLERDLSGTRLAPGPGFTGRHPLPQRAAFAATAGRWGVGPKQCVVVMDRQGGPYAARLWWMLRWLGHSRVWVLDGGVAAWLAAGGALTTEIRPPKVLAAYPLRPSSMPIVSADSLQRLLGRVRLLDARAPERFRGEVEPLDSVAGHVPGALNRPFKDNLDANGCFKPREQLAREFGLLIGRDAPGKVVHQCGSGVTACHNLLAMEAAGMAGCRLYAGSWSEWCADPVRPVARGA